MQTFLRSRRWVAGPSLLAWLSTIMRGQSPSLLAHYNGFFAFTAALLGGLAFGPSEAWAQTTNCTATRTGVNFATRTSGEDWKNRAAERVPTAASFSQLSTAYAASPTNANVTLTTGTLNASQTLVWSTAYSNNAGSSTVTFNFGRTVSNVSIQVDDIDAVFTPAGALGGFLTPSSGYTDEVTFTGTNSGSAVVPTLAKVNTASTYVTTASTATSAVATGQTTAGENTSATDASVIATYANVSSITIQLRNPTAGSTVNGQSVGISTINWCRIVPTTADVTTATVPSTATQVGISGLSGQADGTLTYVVSPLPAQGTLLYNNGGMYTAVAAGQNLTAAQAASLRYTPDASFTGTSTTFTYVLKDDASQTSNTSTYTIPLSPFTACATATNKLTFLTQPAGDDWKKHAALAVPAGSTVTTLSSDGYTSGATTANGSSLVTGNINGVQSLAWTNQYTSTTAGTGTTPGTGRSSSVTFTFNRSVSNLSLQVQDIDFQAGSFTDQVVFSGANGGAPIAPTLTVLNPNSGTVTVSGNTATGRNYNTDNTTDGTVIVYFPSPILTLTITYNNATTSSSISSTQGIGIDYISWCRVAPTANSVTTAAVPNNAAQAGINSLSGTADGTINSYLITSLPANGTLLYNNNGTYAAVAANQALTAAQAASLRYTPDASFTGTSTTFDYKAIDDANLTSANTATYTIPLQYSTPCAINQGTFDFSTRTVNEDWKARTGVPVAPGATTTISSSNYTSAAAAAATGLAIATLNSNTLYWNNDYSGAPRTSSVTFTFSRPVANFSVRIQDIDAANNFIDVVTFAGSNGSTNVTPTLVAANPGAGIVTINGATATGIANTFSTVDGTVTAYFPSPIITLTLTYANGTTAADPDNQAIGIDLMSFCRQAPVASNVTNPSRPAGQGATPINSLNASSADGSITSYTVTAVPAATQGTFFYNNGGTATALTANQTLTPAQATQLTFAPAAGFSGTTSFSYFATDDAGNVSNTATNSVPVTNTGAAGTVAGCAAPGKDGSPTLSTNPNTYYPATASAAAGTTSIAVGAGTLGSTAASATTISKGDLLLVIQMQGADIDYTNTDSYGDGVAGGGASGNLTTNFQAGTYEYVVASNATPITLSTGGTITLASALTNSYVSTAASTTAGPRSFQVVRIPQYANLTLNGTLTALPWNGSVGGIIALDVAGRTSFGGNTIDASGRGFRGGGGRTQGTAAGNNLDYVGTTAANAHAQKGEGTAGTPRYVNVPTTTNDAGTNATVDSGSDGYAGGTFSRGAPGNAGGGGNNNIDNSGGGGGANGGNGGRGGNKFAGANEPVGGEPGTYFGPVSSARLVLGGGGGAGTTNNNTGTPDNGYASSGAAGGGLVLLRTGTVTGTGTILANGGNANSSVGDDGSGGGGAGGSILVTATNTAGLAGLTLTANGGNGGSNLGSANGNGPHGPGGGGGGGVVLANGTVASASASAGANGTTRNSGTTAFGATAGQPGITNAQISSAIAGSAAGTTCVADVATTISGPAAASAGQPTGNYTATFSANGASGAANVTQTVTLPAGAGLTAAQLATIVAAYPGTTITKTGAGASTSTVINFGTTTLLSGTTNSFVFAYTAPTAAGTYNTTSTTTTASNEGGQTANNTSSAATTVGTAADVTVSLSGPTTLNAGQPTGNYTATFTNEGPGTATNVARHVTLPAGASLTLSQQATIQATYTDTTFPTASTIDFGALPSLASDASNTVQFAFTAPATVLNNLTLTANTSTLASEGTNLAPNQTTLALTTVTTADVVARVSGATSLVGNVPTGTFTVNFTNNGPQPAGNVTRTVQLPTGLTGVVVSGADAGSYSPTTGLVTYTTTPTTLASGATLSSTITFPIPATRGQVVATASVSTSTNEAGLTTNNAAAATMPAAYDLATTISGPTTAVAGSPVTLYVTTTNYGPNAAPTALQTVSIPSSAPLTNVYITNGGTYSYNNTTKTGTVTFPDLTNPGSGVTTTNLPGGQTIANSISFTAPAENFAPTATVALNSTSTGTGEMTTDNNTANLNGGVTGSPVAVNTNTAALATANESTTITTTSTVVSAGTSVTYKVAATNQGPGVATNVIQQVLLLPGFSPATLTVGGLTGTPSGNTITYASGGTTVATYSTLTGLLTYATLATQASGATQSFGDIVLTVPASTGNNGQLLASANVRTSTNDPVPADNVAAVAVKVTATADLATTVTGPSSITAGQTASYTVAFTNNGTGTAGTVAETMQLPAGLSNMVVQDPSGNVLAGAYSSTTGLVTFPTIASDAAGATQVYIVAFTAPGQPYSVSSSMGSGTPDNVGTNNSSVLRTTVSPAADVAVTVSGPATATTGNSVTYAATTFNNGPNQASTVVPTIQLPMGLSGVTVIGGTYDAGTGTVTFNAYSLAAGESRVSLVTFTMPANPANGFVTGTASVSTASTDLVASNNTAGVTTAVAPATPDMADLVTSILASNTTLVAGSPLSYTIKFANNTASTPALNVVPTAYLPAGLTGVVVKDINDVIVLNAYNSTTGQVTFPTIASLSAGNPPTYTISLTAPANAAGVAITASAVSANTSDPNPTNNSVGNTVNITASFDEVTRLAGPTTALPGTTNTYSVTTTNNGPSNAPGTANTVQTVTLPAGVVATNITGGGMQSGNVITFPASSTVQAAGANGAVTNTFSIVMPPSGSLALSAAVTSTGESNTTNNGTTLTTAPTNQVPVAENMWNTLQNARGNTSNSVATTGLPISPLFATDPDGSVASYTIATLPDASQGVLYYNGAAATAGQSVAASGLSFAPASTFVGNATFTYTALDNANGVSNLALYTIPVAKDLAAIYTAYNSTKGGVNKYVTGDVLAQVTDTNGASYNDAGLIYDATTGVLQGGGAGNGLPTTGTNATITSGTLPSGVSLDPATGRIYVSNASQLVNNAGPQTYTVTITTVDKNGGVTTQPVSFTIGAYPLPVTLVAFTAQAVANRDAQLNWSTASELHNDHFDIERSFDGTHFTKIGVVAGQGTTSLTSAYAFTDAGVATQAAGPVYYRLRQVDLDGTATFSPVRFVRFVRETSTAPVALGLYPNPAQASTQLDLSQLPATGTYQVLLLDATGRTVRTAMLAGGLPQPLEVQDLARGTYLVRITGQLLNGAAFQQTLRLTKE